MAIKALFPTGQDAITVSGLYQWDYGQVLEIESVDMGSEIVEVHFACTSMTEAIVRSCNFSNGVGKVTIPDDCLEQSTPITAWIYEIEGTQGKTRKVITLPVIARTRPSIARDIPAEISNRYTELITEVNEAVDALENGNVTVKQAQNATAADSAKTAGNASTANYATNSGSATTVNKYLHSIVFDYEGMYVGRMALQFVSNKATALTDVQEFYNELASLFGGAYVPCSGFIVGYNESAGSSFRSMVHALTPSDGNGYIAYSGYDTVVTSEIVAWEFGVLYEEISSIKDTVSKI